MQLHGNTGIPIYLPSADPAKSGFPDKQPEGSLEASPTWQAI